MYYQLIAMDVDGTMVDSRGRLSPAVADAIHQAHRKGAKIVIASGRNMLGVGRILRLLRLDLWYISSGGAQIGHAGDEQVMHRSPLDLADAKAVIRTARQHGAGIFLEEPRELLWEGPQELLERTSSIADIPITVAHDIEAHLDSDPTKITLMHQHEVLVEIERNLEPLADRLHLTYSMPSYLEVTRSGVNKGVALRILAEHLGIPLERVAAVGDGENDILMFQQAGLGIAMGNAPQVVQQSAQLIAPTNDEDGLAWALSQMETRHG